MKYSWCDPQKLVCRLQGPWIEEKEKEKEGEQEVWKANKWEEEEIFAGTELAHQSQHDIVRKERVAITFLVTQFEKTNMGERRFSGIDSMNPGQERVICEFSNLPNNWTVSGGAAEFETDYSSSLKVAFVLQSSIHEKRPSDRIISQMSPRFWKVKSASVANTWSQCTWS